MPEARKYLLRRSQSSTLTEAGLSANLILIQSVHADTERGDEHDCEAALHNVIYCSFENSHFGHSYLLA